MRMTRIETSIRIERSIDEVFAYVADPRNFPTWNSAVTDVRTEAGSTYTMERQLPIGRVENELVVVAREQPTRFALETTSGPTPFAYEFGFAADGETTVIDVAVAAELGAADRLGPLARFGLRRGVDDNLATLKAILDWPS
jgi:carbon monoxide dehydrogenase subunit G